MKKILHTLRTISSLILAGLSILTAQQSNTLVITADELIKQDTLLRVYTITEVIVVGAPERLSKIAGTATILREAELSGSRVYNLNEALRKVPGVNVRDEEGFSLRPNIGLRGLNPTRSTKILLLEDGLPLAYSAYGDNASYYHPPMERFVRTEVLKGSEQILFGPQTISGTINYITPTPPSETRGLLSLIGGSNKNFSGRIRLGSNGMLLDLTRKQGDGSRDNEVLQFTDANFKTIFSVSTQHIIAVRANIYLENSRVTYTGITETEMRNFGLRYNPFENDEFKANRFGLSATHTATLTENTLLTTSAYGSHFIRDWWRQSSTTTDVQSGAGLLNSRLAGKRIDADTIKSTQGRLRNYYTYGIEPRLTTRHKLFGIENELNAGVRAHYEIQKRQQKNATTPIARDGEIVENNNRFTYAYSGFIQNRFLFGEWTLTPAVRIEHVISKRTNDLTNATGKTSFTEIIPGFGATYNPVAGTTVFLSVHRGFAPPRTEDLILTPAEAPSATFTDIYPEKSWNYELGIRTQLQPWLHLETTLFRNDYENLIAVGSIAGGSTPLAQAKALFQGLEFSGRIESLQPFNIDGILYFQTVYTFLPIARQQSPFIQVANKQPVVGSKAGNRMPYAPEHFFTASVGYTTESGWDVRLEGVFVAKQFSDFVNTEAPSFNGNGQVGLISDYTIFNVAINYNIEPNGTSVFITVKNLVDRDYIADRTRGIRPGAQRIIMAGIDFKF